jgi:membrane-associated phospholipid phosphatase
MLILNGLMWISAVPMGGHYITDVLAGTAIAVVATVAVRARWPQEAEGGGTLVLGREPASSMDHPSPPPLRPAPLYH